MNDTAASVFLRELDVADVDAVWAIYGDPTVTEHLSFDPRSRKQVEVLVDNAVADAHVVPRTVYLLAAVDEQANQLHAVVRVAIGPGDVAMLGFAVRSDCWQRGVGTRTAELAIELAFSLPEVSEVHAARSEKNEVSGRLLERLGLVASGTAAIPVDKGGVQSTRESPLHVVKRDHWRKARR